MAQENNQNGQKSSFDRAHDAVNKTRSAYKNVKRVYRTARTVQATAQALIGGFSITGWAIAAALIMVVASTFLISIIGGGGPVNAGTPPTASQPPIYGCGDDLDGVLKSHNITVAGVETCQRKAVIVNAILKLLSYPDFSLKYGSQSLEIANIIDPQGKCGSQTDWIGCTGDGNGFKVRDIDGGKYDDSYWSYIITHEMFHVLDSRTGRNLSSSYDYTTYYSDEPNCYNNNHGGVFTTYQLTTSDKAESMAESGAVYVIGRGGTGSFSISQCPDNNDFWNQEIGLPPTSGGGNTGGNRTGQLVTFTIGNHTVTTNYASSNTCGGKYDLTNTNKFPIGNFGDMNCDFSQDALTNFIQTTDNLINVPFCSKTGKCYPRLTVWLGVIQCESKFNPNDLNLNSKSGWGAWGLFQMNPDFSGRAPHDNGTTDWRTQVANAITRNNNVSGGKFGYWGCSKRYRLGTK